MPNRFIKVLPREGMGMRSYLIELKEKNVLLRMDTLFIFAGIRAPEPKYLDLLTPQYLPAIAKLSEVGVKKLYNMTFHSYSEYFQEFWRIPTKNYKGLRYYRLSRNRFSDLERMPHVREFNKRVVCKKCIREEGFSKLCWNLKYITACPDHGILLTHPNTQVNNCGEIEKLANAVIYHFLRVPIKMEPFDSLKFPDLNLKVSSANFFSFFNFLIEFIKSLEPQEYLSGRNLDLNYDNNVISQAYTILSDWPESLYLLLDQFLEKQNKKPGSSENRLFGLESLYSLLLKKAPQNNLFKIFLQGIRSFIEKKFVFPGLAIEQNQVGKSFTHWTRKILQYPPFNTPSDEYNSPTIFNKCSQYVDWDVIDSYLKEKGKNCYSLREYQKKMNIPYDVLVFLFENGFLETVLFENTMFSEKLIDAGINFFGFTFHANRIRKHQPIHYFLNNGFSNIYIDFDHALHKFQGNEALFFKSVAARIIRYRPINNKKSTPNGYLYSETDLNTVKNILDQRSIKNKLLCDISCFERPKFKDPAICFWRQSGLIQSYDANPGSSSCGSIDRYEINYLKLCLITFDQIMVLLNLSEPELNDFIKNERLVSYTEPQLRVYSLAENYHIKELLSKIKNRKISLSKVKWFLGTKFPIPQKNISNLVNQIIDEDPSLGLDPKTILVRIFEIIRIENRKLWPDVLICFLNEIYPPFVLSPNVCYPDQRLIDRIPKTYFLDIFKEAKVIIDDDD